MAETDRQTGRIQWLDVLKGILILFVILSHSYPTALYRRFFTPFFLTMFFFASGYTFSTKSSFGAFLKNKGKRLLIPFFVLGSVRVAMACVLSGDSPLKRIKGFLLQISCQDDELWFVSCLFVSSLLFYGIVRLCSLLKESVRDGLLLLFSLAGTLLGMADICLWKVKCIWEMELACLMLFYMALGYLYRRHQEEAEKWAGRLPVLLVLSVVYVAGVLAVPNDVDIHAEQFTYPMLFFALSLIVIPPILALARVMCRAHFRRALVFLGANTLFYYAFAGIVRIVFYGICGRLGIEGEWILPLCCMLLSAAALSFPAWLVKKYAPWAVGA